MLSPQLEPSRRAMRLRVQRAVAANTPESYAALVEDDDDDNRDDETSTLSSSTSSSSSSSLRRHRRPDLSQPLVVYKLLYRLLFWRHLQRLVTFLDMHAAVALSTASSSSASASSSAASVSSSIALPLWIASLSSPDITSTSTNTTASFNAAAFVSFRDLCPAQAALALAAHEPVQYQSALRVLICAHWPEFSNGADDMLRVGAAALPVAIDATAVSALLPRLTHRDSANAYISGVSGASGSVGGNISGWLGALFPDVAPTGSDGSSSSSSSSSSAAHLGFASPWLRAPAWQRMLEGDNDEVSKRSELSALSSASSSASPPSSSSPSPLLRLVTATQQLALSLAADRRALDRDRAARRREWLARRARGLVRCVWRRWSYFVNRGKQ